MGNRRATDTDLLDDVGRSLLAALQENARQPYAQLARSVGLTPPAVAERLKRMEVAGLIQGYQAQVNRAALGWKLAAFVRIRAFPGKDAAIEEFARDRAEVLECHEVTGEDSYLLKITAPDVKHLDRVITALAPLGSTHSVMVLSTKVAAKPLAPVEG